MSNWSVVSVSYSGLEQLVPEELPIFEKYHWVVTSSVERDESPGNAVEWWMTTHINHFDPEDLARELRDFTWRLPYEVCIVWKSEHMNVPRVEMAFPELVEHVENPEQVRVLDSIHRLRHP